MWIKINLFDIFTFQYFYLSIFLIIDYFQFDIFTFGFCLFLFRYFYLSIFLPFDIFPFRPKLGLPKILITNMFSYSTDILRVKLFEIFFSSIFVIIEISFFEHPFFWDSQLRDTGFSKYQLFEILCFRNIFFRLYFLRFIFSALFLSVFLHYTPYQRCPSRRGSGSFQKKRKFKKLVNLHKILIL